MNPHLVRQFDHVLGDGTFRLGMTRRGRVIMVIDVTESALGPLHLFFEVGRPEPMVISTGGIFDDIGHAISHPADAFSNVAKGLSHAASDVGRAVEKGARDVGHAAEHTAEGAFNAASKIVTTVARPAFNLARDAAASGAHLVASLPFVPEAERKRIEAASRVIMRARLGDVHAKDFIRTVANAANAGVQAARSVGDALLTGTKVVTHVLDTPFRLAEHVPLIGSSLHALSPVKKFETMADAIQRGDLGAMTRIVTDNSPFQKAGKMADAVQRGDLQAVKQIATEDARMVANVAAIVPGVGTGIASGLQAGLALIDGGSPIDIAVHAAYGAIPIPPGIRNVTDAVLEAVLKLAHGSSITDAALATARSAVPSGIPRDVFDTLVQIVVKRVPIHHAAEALVEHYVQRYVPAVAAVAETVRHVTQTPAHLAEQAASIVDASKHLAPGSLVRLLPAAVG